MKAALLCLALVGCVEGTPYEPEPEPDYTHVCRHIMGCRPDSAAAITIRVPNPTRPDSAG